MKARWLFLGFVGAVLAGAQVEKPVDPFGDNPPPLRVGLIAEPGQVDGIEAKLREIRIPLIDFVETPLEDALEFLRLRAEELDATPDEEGRGINIMLKTTVGWATPKVSLGDEKNFSFSLDQSPRVTFRLQNVPLGSAIRIVAEAVGLEMRVEPEMVVLMSPGEDVAGLMATQSRLEGELAAWSGAKIYEGDETPLFPSTTLLEALQSEYRKLQLRRSRLDPLDGAGKVLMDARIEATKAAIEEARELLLGYWEAERELGEAWQAEIAE